MILQQASALWKLPGIAIVFFVVTGTASNHQIVDAINGGVSIVSAQGKGMIGMVFAPLDFLPTIVALALLPLILLLNLLGSMHARNPHFECSSLRISGTIGRAIGYIVFMVPYSNGVLTSFIRFTTRLKTFFSLNGVVRTPSSVNSFSIGVSILPMIFSPALLATRVQFALTASMKILRSSGKNLIAGACTTFERGIIGGYNVHDKGQLLVRPSGVTSTARASSCFPYYSTKPPVVQYQEVSA